MKTFVFIRAHNHAHQLGILRLEVIQFVGVSIQKSVNPCAHCPHFVIIFDGSDFHDDPPGLEPRSGGTEHACPQCNGPVDADGLCKSGFDMEEKQMADEFNKWAHESAEAFPEVEL